MDHSNPLTTFAISAGALILGIPVAAAAIIFEKVYVPNIILGTKEIKAGIDVTKTISFSLLSGPNDAVISGASISIISVLLFCAGLTVVRHFSRHNIAGWVMFSPALLNLLGQIGVLAYVQIVQGQHPAATSTDEIKYVNSTYDTNGKLYTREAWACSMDKLYNEQEGSWASKACSNLKAGRTMTFPLLICSAGILAIAFWQVQCKGGLGWLFGRTKSITAMKRNKGEYIDLQG